MYPVFIGALFTVAKTWREPRCPLTYEWVQKMWYIHILPLHHKKDEIMSFSATLMDFSY